jgi:chlorophyll synthase
MLVDRLVFIVGCALGDLGLLGRCLGLGPGLGLQRATLAPEGKRLVGQCRLCAQLRRLGLVTGAAVMLGERVPPTPVLCLALLYSLGAHGIMTLNDFKAVEGDRHMGVRSLPVQLGVEGAARVACWAMVLPQVVVVGLLMAWGQVAHALGVLGLILGQLPLMGVFVRQPVAKALMLSGFGVPLFVAGMMVSAWAVRLLPGAGS